MPCERNGIEVFVTLHAKDFTLNSPLIKRSFIIYEIGGKTSRGCQKNWTRREGGEEFGYKREIYKGLRDMPHIS